MTRREMSRWQCGQMTGRASSPHSGIAYSCRASKKPTSAQTRVGQGKGGLAGAERALARPGSEARRGMASDRSQTLGGAGSPSVAQVEQPPVSAPGPQPGRAPAVRDSREFC
jgi:hypothetical protein